MITFSIVTITYNAEGVLAPTLDSVLSQDYLDVEHIIVDGASHDGTMRMVRDYVSRS
ncbi:MAG: glycosyltransferase, partial [Prevotella sp.]|nr:glycosyltransferase [Prevotella sp.]